MRLTRRLASHASFFTPVDTQRYVEVDTSNVAEVLDTIGHLHQSLAPEFRPFPATGPRLAGWAYTIRGQMTSDPVGETRRR